MRRALVIFALLLSPPAFAQNLTDLRVVAETPFARPGLPYTLHVGYWNQSQVTATGAVLTVTAAVDILQAPAGCTISGRTATCDVGTLPGWTTAPHPDFRGLSFVLRALDANEQQFDVRVEIQSQGVEGLPENNVFTAAVRTMRAFYVTSTADAGSGSLREAIHNANAACFAEVPCLIGFRIANASAQWVTIAPETPLPPITRFNIAFDGNSQTEFFGDSNPLGPEVELSGGLQREGNGLSYFGCTGFAVRGLAINGFPGNGILLAGDHDCQSQNVTVENNYIGTDPTGTRAIGNQRGIYVDGFVQAAIQHNVISGNVRSGLYVQRGSVAARRNIIGLTPDVAAPLGNGASGVYLGAASGGSDVSHNHIGFSLHWGIAIHPLATFISAAPNSLQANVGLGIDWGFDMNPENGPVGLPDITSVRVENGQTIIEGTVSEANNSVPNRIDVYANDAPDPSGYGEGQYTLGSVELSPTRTFRFVYPGDLRGKWVTATLTHTTLLGLRAPGEDDISSGIGRTTSDFSRAVLVP
ncbi:MAG TPA: right-handed parallel beta-helix repeat-containing protein [Thermoanaerobaculia bacterium]|nr:right-handed parallel beta-helix repeat-containing protein [Thermoanaerobaculia bacterium]